ncbi:TPA: ABC transporter permease [Candidatus Woesearchaeota archaeon]|nr:ABC transporter permease [Candidatus Woesearchaeota archaeon]
MKLHKIFKHALGMVLHSRLRSWLTIIGIVIGVASVVAIIALSDGMEAAMANQFSDKGVDLLTITAGASRSGGFGGGPPREGSGGASSATDETPELTRSDVQTLRGINMLGDIDTQVSGSADIYYLGQTGSIGITGVDQTVWDKMTNPTIQEGRSLGPADSNVIVIGGRLANGFFDRPAGLNKAISIEGRSFRIVGILNDSSTSIYMPVQQAYQVLDDKEQGVYDRIIVKVRDPDQVTAAAAVIKEEMAIRRHSTDKADFSVSDPAAMLATRQQMMASMTLFLTAIAAVALIVGAVGVANTMFTSVLERTKQIGIMKAIGATRNDILLLFLFNAALIGLIGGLLGVLFGYLLAQMMPLFMNFGPGETVALVRLSTVLLALGVSTAIGILAGTIPAWNASKLRPVDALRYE